MPKYVPTQLIKFDHKKTAKPVPIPMQPKPRVYGKDAQLTDPVDTSPIASENDKKRIEKVVGSFQYYGCAVNSTTLHTFISIAELQSKPTKKKFTKQIISLITWQHSHPQSQDCMLLI